MNSVPFAVLIFGLTMAALSLVGWIANIIQLVHAMAAPITGMFIFKCVGVLLAPLGAVLGWVGMF